MAAQEEERKVGAKVYGGIPPSISGHHRALRLEFRPTTAPSCRSPERKARQPGPRPSEYTFAYSSQGAAEPPREGGWG